LLSELGRERYGDNVHFLDGERLEALNEWSTLQSDANARVRLIGLRSALRFIIADLKNTALKGQETLAPLFVAGIELYLSEPVNCDDKLLVLLFQLWSYLQSIEGLRKIGPITSPVAKRQLPKIAKIAESSLPLAIEACQMVDAAIERMKPLG
jgi:hypothetical protein